MKPKSQRHCTDQQGIVDDCEGRSIRCVKTSRCGPPSPVRSPPPPPPSPQMDDTSGFYCLNVVCYCPVPSLTINLCSSSRLSSPEPLSRPPSKLGISYVLSTGPFIPGVQGFFDPPPRNGDPVPTMDPPVGKRPVVIYPDYFG